MDPIFWLDISRGTLIIASIITAIGGIGIWHFGKINTKNQNDVIRESNDNAAKSNQIAAQANKKIEELKIDVIEANISLEKEKRKTEQIKLEAEAAKIERERLQQKTILLTNNQRVISSFKIKIRIELPTAFSAIRKKNSIRGLFASSIEPALFISKNKKNSFGFILEPNTYLHQKSTTTLEMGITYSPNGTNSIIGSDIELLEQIEFLEIATQSFPDIGDYVSKLELKKNAKLIAILEINGKEYTNKIVKGRPNEIVEKNNTIILPFNDFLEETKQNFLKDLEI